MLTVQEPPHLALTQVLVDVVRDQTDMTTHRLANEKVPVFAFEVSVLEIGHRRIARMLEDTPGVSNVSIPRTSSSSDVLVKFTYQNTDFIVCEPFGDNSRYWIGPVAEADTSMVDISCIEQVFANSPANPLRSFLAKIFG